MDLYGWIQLTLYLLILLHLTKPLGLYLTRVLDEEGRTFLDPVLKPVERLVYRSLRLEPKNEQDWKQYTLSLLAFSFVGLLFTYILLRLQNLLPLNPQGFGAVRPDLAFNTAAKFHHQHQLASGRPGGVDEDWVSFAAAPASAYPSGPRCQVKVSLNLG